MDMTKAEVENIAYSAANTVATRVEKAVDEKVSGVNKRIDDLKESLESSARCPAHEGIVRRLATTEAREREGSASRKDGFSRVVSLVGLAIAVVTLIVLLVKLGITPAL